MVTGKIKATITIDGGDTPNIFIWNCESAEGNEDALIAKIWLYPNGKITYRSFVPKTTHEITLRKAKESKES